MTPNQKAIEQAKADFRRWLDLQEKQAKLYGPESVRAAKSERAYCKRKGLI